MYRRDWVSIYAISDLHLSLNSNKSMDIFPGWKNYVNRIKENWINTIKDEDTVVIAGDISWAMKINEAKKDFEFINNLPGKKIFIKGNHDYWWNTAKKVNEFLNENNFKSISIIYNSAEVVGNVCICGTRGWMYNSEEPEDEKILARETARLVRSLDCSLEYGLEPIVFLHYPPVYNFQESEEIINVLIERNIKKCYYGHIHGGGAKKGVIQGKYKGIELKLISCDYIDFKPLLIVR